MKILVSQSLVPLKEGIETPEENPTPRISSRQRILNDLSEQEFLRKHIALGIPMNYVAWKFDMTPDQVMSLIRELGII